MHNLDKKRQSPAELLSDRNYSTAFSLILVFSCLISYSYPEISIFSYSDSERTYEHCEEGNGDDDYYNGFIDRCMSIEGNTRGMCESATDA